MARRLVVDTGVLIDPERGGDPYGSLVTAEDDLVIAAVTVAELCAGVELAGEAHRGRRTEFLLQVLETLPVEPYDVATAEAHGRLLAHVHTRGVPRGAHDLLVAATGVATGRTVLTTDRTARFENLPGVACLVLR